MVNPFFKKLKLNNREVRLASSKHITQFDNFLDSLTVSSMNALLDVPTPKMSIPKFLEKNEKNWFSIETLCMLTGIQYNNFIQKTLDAMFNLFSLYGFFELNLNKGVRFYRQKKMFQSYSLDLTINKIGGALKDVVEFFIDNLKTSLNKGQPSLKRDDHHLQLIWEIIFRINFFELLLTSSFEKIDEEFMGKESKSVSILDYSSDGGVSTTTYLDNLLKQGIKNTEITIYAYEEVSVLLQRSQLYVQSYVHKNKLIRKSGITVNLNYFQLDLVSDTHLPEKSINIAFIPQKLQFMKEEVLDSWFKSIEKILKTDGTLIMPQLTNPSKKFDNPFSILFASVEDFEGYPLTDTLYEISSKSFNNVKFELFNSLWIMKNI